MMREVSRIDGRDASATEGEVVWSPVKSLWNGSMLATVLVFGPTTLSLSSGILFVTLTWLTLLFGHSVGLHRRLIHRSYDCAKWLERTLVYIGVIVGVAGPFGILRVHDMRDWAQRQPQCHDFFSHRRSFLRDVFWQLHCRFDYARPPRFTIEPEFADDPWYRCLDRTWMLQQIPVGVVLFLIGGWAWIVWGIAARVTISSVGHWGVTYWCHNPGAGSWRVAGAGVQASNLPGLGLLTYGECWHNNHHAFPESARIGLEPGQTDPGWWVLQRFAAVGWVWNLGQPRPEHYREDIFRIDAAHAQQNLADTAEVLSA